MTVTILDGESAEVSAGSVAPQTTSNMRIDGRDREVKTAVVGGKTVVYTEFLTVSEKRKLSRAMLPNDVLALEAYGYNQVAARVRMIDGNPIGFPASDSAIEQILAELGDEAAEFLFEQGHASLSARREERAKNSLKTAGSV